MRHLLVGAVLAAVIIVPPRCLRMCAKTRATEKVGCVQRCIAILDQHEREKLECGPQPQPTP